MIHRLLLIKLNEDTPPQQVEDMMIETRIRLLKIPEVMNLKSGKRIATGNPFQMFIALEAENMSKIKVIEESAIYLKFRHQILDPNASELRTMDYEMEPGKDISFS